MCDYLYKLHNAVAMITMSSRIFLLVQFVSVSEKILYSFNLLMAFSTLILALAISRDCYPPELRGVIHFKNWEKAKKTCALYPLSARTLWPGFKSVQNPTMLESKPVTTVA